MGEVTFDLSADFYPLLDPAFSGDHYIPPTCSRPERNASVTEQQVSIF